ncbi:MAG TPA: ATP-binding protein [Verrucomicrobiae bacterium]|nr:ATP-binding protein [Verrucomicrobiae bacterium]
MPNDSSDTTFERLSRVARESPFFSSLQTRLILLVLMAILPALGLIFFNALKQRKQAQLEAQRAALRVVRMAASQQEHLIEGARQLLATLAQLHEVQTREPVACERIFSNLIALDQVYANIGACNPDGTVFASAMPISTNVSAADRTYFQLATNTGRFAIGEYQVGRITRKATLNFGYPVFAPNTQLQAVVFAALDLNWLRGIVTNVHLPPNSSLTVIDRNRITLVRFPDDSYVGQELHLRRPLADEGAGPWRSRDGTWRLGAYTRLSKNLDANSPVVSVGIPLSAAYAAANETLVRNVIFLGIAAILALAAAWYGGRIMILHRVRTLVAATVRLSTGDLKARTKAHYGRGELGQLARAFDEMAQSLEERVAERERAESELQNLNRDLEGRVALRTIELRRSNEDLDQFASVASHDLQEPLRMVTNYLGLLEQRFAPQLDVKAREFIRYANDGAARMQQLIRDLLTYSRVSTKAQPFEQVDLERVFNRAVANLKLAIEESDALITHDPLPGLLGDPLLLTQLFQNLLSNGIKFRRDVRPEIHLHASRHHDEWLFSVKDNGIGLEARNFERVFIIFQRLHTREKYPGTGIGLALCKKIVARHHGRIWVESKVGAGTTFYFTIALDLEAGVPGQ